MAIAAAAATDARGRLRAVAAKHGPSIALSLAICLAIAGPWLRSGYVFATDFSGPRHFLFPETATSFAPLQIALALLGSVMPGDVVGKVLILAIFFVTAFSAYQAAPTFGFAARGAASVVYTFNPFVYDRISYGQLTVLSGYALLPLAAVAVRRLLRNTDLRSALGVAAVFVATAAVDIHFVVIAAVLSGCLVGADVAVQSVTTAYVKRVASRVAVAAVAFVLASAYWIVPFVRGTSVEARTLSQISDADLRAFSTTPDANLGLVPNLLGLYGFWAESTNRFVPLKQFVPLWPLILLVLLAICAVGAFAGLRDTGSINVASNRTLVIGLAIASALSLVLAMGISESHTAALVRWIDSFVPQYRGMRDAAKWVSVLAFAYSQLLALGVAKMFDWTRGRKARESVREATMAAIAAVALATPLYYGNGLLYGAHDQIRPSPYPDGWYAADRNLAADPQHGRALFLPWHGYFALSFVHNSDKVVANPAPLFFSVPIVASRDLEIPGIAPPNEHDQTVVAALVKGGATSMWARALAVDDIKYVLIAKEVDWTSYTYLANAPGLEQVADYGSILLYRNLEWQAGGH